MTNPWCGVSVLLLVLACDSTSEPSSTDRLDASLSTTFTTAPSTSKEATTGNGVSSKEATSTAAISPDAPSTSEHGTTNTAVDSMAEESPPDAGIPSTDVSPGTQDADASQTVSCDQRKLTCRRTEPACDYGFVPRIVNGCYEDCVPIDTCVCDGPEACPYEERYTCNNSRKRCTPYLN